MRDLTITITLDEDQSAHVCGPDCDCPRALARTQDAIDQDRAARGAMPRTLSQRLHAMRYAAPATRWFEDVSLQAKQLEELRELNLHTTPASTQAETWAATEDSVDAAVHHTRASVLRDQITETVRDMERAELLPQDHEHHYDANAETSYVYLADHVLTAEMTGSLDSPAAHYIIKTYNEEEQDSEYKRTTTDLKQVRAWLMAWAVAHATE